MTPNEAARVVRELSEEHSAACEVDTCLVCVELGRVAKLPKSRPVAEDNFVSLLCALEGENFYARLDEADTCDLHALVVLIEWNQTVAWRYPDNVPVVSSVYARTYHEAMESHKFRFTELLRQRLVSAWREEGRL